MSEKLLELKWSAKIRKKEVTELILSSSLHFNIAMDLNRA